MLRKKDTKKVLCCVTLFLLASLLTTGLGFTTLSNITKQEITAKFE
jgi:hypothetical protein